MKPDLENTQNDKFKFLFESLPFGVIHQDDQGRVLETNPAAEKMLGVPRDQVQECLTRAIQEDGLDFPMELQPATVALKTGRPVHNVVMGFLDPAAHSLRWFNVNSEPRVQPGKKKPQEVYTIIEDVTMRKQAEHSLQESEERYRLLTDNITDVIWVLDLQTNRYRYISPSVELLRGYTVDEVLAMDMAASVTPDSLQYLQQVLPGRIQEMRAGVQKVYTDEIEQSCKDGTRIWTETKTRFIPHLQPDHFEVYGVSRDISVRRKAEKGLQESEKRYRGLFENSPVALWEEDFSAVKIRMNELRNSGVKDFKQYFAEHPQEVHAFASLVKILDVNKAAVSMVAAKGKEDLLKSLADSLPKETVQGFEKELLHIANGYTEFSWEGQNMTLDGRLIDIHLKWSVAPGYVDDLSRVIVSILDVTARKQAEEELRRSEQNYRGLLEQASDGIFISDKDGLYTLVNEAACRLVGYTKEELLSMNLRDLLPSEELLKQPLRLDKLRSGKTVLIERMLLHKDGHRIPCELSAIQLPDGRFQSFVRNIARRKQAEEAQLRSEQRYRTLFEDSPIAIWEEDFSKAKKYLDELRQGGVTDLEAFFTSHPDALQECTGLVEITNVNQAALRMYGAKSKRELIKATHQTVSPGEWLHIHEDFQAITDGRHSNHWDGADETISGEPLEISLHWSVVPGYEEDYSRIILTTMDITEQKKTELALRESEEQKRALLNAVPDLLFQVTAEGIIIDFHTPNGTEMFAPPEEFLQRKLTEVLPPNVAQMSMKAIETSLRLNTMSIIEYTLPIRGRSLFYENRVVPLSGKKVLSVIRDITEQKQAEEALRESESRFHSMFEKHNAVMLLIEPDSGAILDANEAAEKFYGYSVARLKSMLIENINTLPQAEVAQLRMEALNQGLNYFIFPHQLATGEIREVEVHSSPISIGGKPVLFSIIHDVTIRQQAETAIRESEAKFRSLVDQSVDGVVLVDQSGVVIEWNHGEEQITGIPRSEAIGSYFWDIQQKILAPERRSMLTKEHLRSAFFNTFITGRSPQLGKAYEANIVFATGEHKVILQTAFLIKSEGGPRIGAIVRDITERKQGEERLRAALEEKEALLREVHHRVKNNLQAMIALMDMQANQIDDEVVRTFLKELEGQARTMSLVYEQLYQSENLARVKVPSYLHQLTGYILESFGKKSTHTLHLDVDDISLDVAQAMPCGLIINELYTNALKHAFPPGFQGDPVVRIELHQAGQEIRLTVSDNGAGLPQSLDWHKGRSLGMRLVNLWVTHQLGGTLEINSTNGTTFLIAFKV
ncbi:MAG TPA: PAS domain S-box protein [Anaerolineales bacterium]|nr:PAS domain S-box protein [Anaerolineales bacterium]